MGEERTELASAARNYWSETGYSPGGIIREIDYAKVATGLHPLLQGIKIVDCDTHFTEPPDIFTSRAPAKLKDKVPHQRVVNGVTALYPGVQAHIVDTLGGYAPEVRKRVLERNAVELYNLPF